MADGSGWLKKLATPSLNWLLIFFPIAIFLELTHGDPVWIFVSSAIAIIPVAGWMGHATEELSSRLGEGIGGLLNATFGNAAELIIALIALIRAAVKPEEAATLTELVKASLTGSIIGNVLLVLGAALFVGGLRHKEQRFNPTASRVGATLLTISIAALLIPTLFAHFVPDHHAEIGTMSYELSVILLIVYAMSLGFTLLTHKHLYKGSGDAPQADSGHEGQPWSIKLAVSVLLGATTCVAVLAEFMIGSVHAAAATVGLTDLFVGVIVVAVVGNAAEHSTAVLVAWRNRMDLSLSIAVGSSIQIALFIAPALVLTSYALGVDMDLVFTVPEMVAMGIALAVLDQIAGDGESNWLEGALLLVVYIMLGVLFYHLPSGSMHVPG